MRQESLLWVVFVVACGGEVGVPVDGGVDAANGDASSVTCPPTEPDAGESCTPPSTCAYRTSALCVVYAQCGETNPTQGFVWDLAPTAGCSAPPTDCPSTFASVAVGTTCSLDSSAVCAYAQGNCACEACETDGGASENVWRCNAYASLSGCPSALPLPGEACTSNGQTCDYGHCCDPPALGLPMQCEDGTWKVYVNTGCFCGVPLCP